MPRPQFTLKTLLWLMVCVACFFAGMSLQQRWDDDDDRRFIRLMIEEANRKDAIRLQITTRSEWSQNGEPLP